METKKEFKIFTIAQHKEEEQYLRRMHKEGWKFVKVTGIGMYHFEKCQPEDVVYQLDYNTEGSANKEEYIRMFADCGWEYIQEFVGFSYFRKRVAEMDGDEEIFSDDNSRLAMQDRIRKGRVLPLVVIFLAVLLPQFIMNLSNGNYGIAALLGVPLVVYVVIFIIFAVRHYHRKN